MRLALPPLRLVAACAADAEQGQKRQKGGIVPKKKLPEMTAEDALDALAGWHHSFVGEEAANRTATALGVRKPVPCHPGHSDRDGNPKGLSMNPGQEGSRGIAGWHLAQWICGQLGIVYESKMGRGFQTQACVEALARHFRIGRE